MSRSESLELAPFSYELPEARIAQRPVYPYDAAKLLHVRCGAQTLDDRIFHELPTLLRAGDLLVLNNSVVKPARFFGKLVSGGHVELLLVGQRGPDEYEAIGRPIRKLLEGTRVLINAELSFEVLRRVSDKTVIVRAQTVNSTALDSSGIMPIPPYIRGGKGDERDRLDYQSRFAATSSAEPVVDQSSSTNSATSSFFGSIAAPTASLHFTAELVSKLEALGVGRAFLRLDVGLASVLSVVQEDGSVRPPGVEQVHVPTETLAAIAQTRSNGGRVVAVGTTVVRALESVALNPGASAADIFIRPGHKFQNCDLVITNFHQPASSHLLLVEALMGPQLLQRSYQRALDHGYRFLSYGDAMLIEPRQI